MSIQTLYQDFFLAAQKRSSGAHRKESKRREVERETKLRWTLTGVVLLLGTVLMFGSGWYFQTTSQTSSCPILAKAEDLHEA